MKSFRFFCIAVVAIAMWFIGDFFYESYELAAKACYAWAASVSLSCTVGFLYPGVIQNLSQSVLFATLFDGSILEVQPNALLGFAVLAGFVFVEFLLVAAMLMVVRSLRSEERQNWGELIFAISLVGVLGVVVITFLGQAPADSSNRQIMLNPTYGKMKSDPGALMMLFELVGKPSTSAAVFEAALNELVIRDDVDPIGLSKVFDTALGRCRDDLIAVLLKFDMKPHPRGYDPGYMQSMYLSNADPACDKIFESMGWSKGCEVEVSNDVCDQFTRSEAEYFSLFENAALASTATCQTNADCYRSESGKCGRALTVANGAFSEYQNIAEKNARCPLKKLFTLCARKDPGYLVCDTLVQPIPKCVESKCLMVEP